MKILAEEAYPSDGEMFRRYNIVMDAELKRRKTDKTVDHTVESIVSFNEKKTWKILLRLRWTMGSSRRNALKTGG